MYGIRMRKPRASNTRISVRRTGLLQPSTAANLLKESTRSRSQAMLNILGNSQRTCGGWSRRSVLQAGGMGLFGLSLPKLLAAEEAQQGTRLAKAKSVIFLFLFGGPSQLETFDMKPEAP